MSNNIKNSKNKPTQAENSHTFISQQMGRKESEGSKNEEDDKRTKSAGGVNDFYDEKSIDSGKVSFNSSTTVNTIIWSLLEVWRSKVQFQLNFSSF